MAGLILGMMTRTTLGHTGRPLVAGRAETLIFVLIQASAFLRVGTALAGKPSRVWSCCSLPRAGRWALPAMWWYLLYLTSPRLDGKPG
jgi:uncharacterized protein involved in response to NO